MSHKRSQQSQSHQNPQSGYPGPPSGPGPMSMGPGMTPNGQIAASYNGGTCTPVSFLVNIIKDKTNSLTIISMIFTVWKSWSVWIRRTSTRLPGILWGT